MTYAAFDTGTAGDVLELYHFQGPSEEWTYTSGDRTFVHLSREFRPALIRRTAPTSSADGQGRITLRMARDNPVALAYRIFVPTSTVWVAIYRTHLSDPDGEVVLYWSGRVRSVRWEGSEAMLDCEPASAMLERDGLRPTFQASCNWTLYDGRCRVNDLAHQTPVDPAGIAGVGTLTMTAPEFSSKPDGWWTGGYIVRNFADRRLIVGHAGNTITLHLPFESIATTDVVHIYPGCDHTLATCRDKFGNLPNYGGFPFVPRKNPFTDGLE